MILEGKSIEFRKREEDILKRIIMRRYLKRMFHPLQSISFFDK